LGHRALLEEIRWRLCVEVVGIDLNPPSSAPFPVLRGDAVHHPLPACDAARRSPDRNCGRSSARRLDPTASGGAFLRHQLLEISW
jgi:hypothetical protein